MELLEMYNTNSYDDDDQEMSMDEILASIRRYVSPESQNNTEKAQTGQSATESRDPAKVRTIVSDQPAPLRAAPLQEFISKPTYNPFTSPASHEGSSLNSSRQDYHNTDVVRLHTPAQDSFHENTGVSAVPQGHESLESIHTVETLPTSFSTPSSVTSTPTVVSEESLVSPQTLTTASSAFAKLNETMSKHTQQHATHQVESLPSNSVTLDQMFATLAKPMIREWLDKNLPTLVETLVTREIEKITQNFRT